MGPVEGKIEDNFFLTDYQAIGSEITPVNSSCSYLLAGTMFGCPRFGILYFKMPNFMLILTAWKTNYLILE
jgi:hypothetical protein